MYWRGISVNRINLLLKRGDPADTCLSPIQWMLGQTPEVQVTSIRNKCLFKEICSLTFSLCLCRSTLKSTETSVSAFGPSAVKSGYAAEHRCGGGGHMILRSTVNARLAVARPASHDPWHRKKAAATSTQNVPGRAVTFVHGRRKACSGWGARC